VVEVEVAPVVEVEVEVEEAPGYSMGLPGYPRAWYAPG